VARETHREIKQKLARYQNLKQELRQIECRIAVLEMNMQSPRSPSLDGMPRGNGNHDGLIRQIDAHQKLLALYEKQKADLLAAQLCIEQMIAGLETVERQIFRYRYLDGMYWEEISERVHYSLSHVHRFHGTALQKLANAYRKTKDETQ
jgi:RNA polymerase sigma factor (sigma-70 family)